MALVLSQGGWAAEEGRQAASEPDYESIAGLITGLYESVSFDPGETPDWNLVRSFFLPEAVVVFAARGSRPTQVMDLDGFIADFVTFYDDADIATRGFWETVAGTEVVLYGNIAHAFVVFEPRRGPERDGPTTPGIDSLELVQHDGRWWVAAITTQFSSQALPIPARFLEGS